MRRKETIPNQSFMNMSQRDEQSFAPRGTSINMEVDEAMIRQMN